MKNVKLELTFAYGDLTIRYYDDTELANLIQILEQLCTSGRVQGSEIYVEEMIPKIFPSFSDDDILDFTEKMSEEIEGLEEASRFGLERKFNLGHFISYDMQMLSFWYRLREALYVNWKHLQEREV